MIGLPTETKEDIWNTIRFVGELKISKPKFHIFYPFKNTQLYQYCVDNNIIDYSKATGNVSMRETCFINQDFDSHFLYNTLYKLPAYLNLYVSKKTNLLFSEISKITDLNKYRKRFNSMSDYCKLKRIEHYGYCAHVPYLFSDFNNYKIPSFYKTMYFGEL
jgi:radical SAM superfamily enzyme YgiQ (UPF0313 family)